MPGGAAGFSILPFRIRVNEGKPAGLFLALAAYLNEDGSVAAAIVSQRRKAESFVLRPIGKCPELFLVADKLGIWIAVTAIRPQCTSPMRFEYRRKRSS